MGRVATLLPLPGFVYSVSMSLLMLFKIGGNIVALLFSVDRRAIPFTYTNQHLTPTNESPPRFSPLRFTFFLPSRRSCLLFLSGENNFVLGRTFTRSAGGGSSISSDLRTKLFETFPFRVSLNLVEIPFDSNREIRI